MPVDVEEEKARYSSILSVDRYALGMNGYTSPLALQMGSPRGSMNYAGLRDSASTTSQSTMNVVVNGRGPRGVSVTLPGPGNSVTSLFENQSISSHHAYPHPHPLSHSHLSQHHHHHNPFDGNNSIYPPSPASPVNSLLHANSNAGGNNGNNGYSGYESYLNSNGPSDSQGQGHDQMHHGLNGGSIPLSTEIESEIMNSAPLGNENARSSRGGGEPSSGSSTHSSSRDRHRSQGQTPNRRGAQHVMISAEERARINNGLALGWDVLEIAGGVRNMGKSLLSMTHLGALYMANNQISRIPPGIASLKNLTILDLSSNRLRVVPQELGLLLQLRHLYLQQNYLRTLPFELGRLYKLTTLALDGNPLMNEIFEVYNEYGVEKFLQFLLDQLIMDSPPPPVRTRMPIFQPLVQSDNARIQFSVMCYNVLCGQYCSRAQYGYCPTWALDWDYRRKGIMQEIRRNAADLICLQEVETEQYYSFFVPEFRNEGIEGCFVPKSRAKTMHGAERSHVDGCAIFYNTQKFEFVEDYTVEFSHLAMSYAHSDGCVTEASENMLNRVMPKDNVGLVALLRVKSSILPTASSDENDGSPSSGFTQQPYVLVVNAHVHWDPEYCDVKLIQCIMLSSRLRDIANDVSLRYYKLSSPDPQVVPIIFTGDMNSLPDSGVYEFFLKGQINFLHKDFRGIRYKQCIARYSAVDKEKEYISHGLQLADSYHKIALNHTNYTLDFKGVIDYIMYSRNHLNCLGVLRPLCKEWLENNRIVGFPHPHIPSDHIPIYAEFELFAHSVLDVERIPAVDYGQDDYESSNLSLNLNYAAATKSSNMPF